MGRVGWQLEFSARPVIVALYLQGIGCMWWLQYLSR